MIALALACLAGLLVLPSHSAQARAQPAFKGSAPSIDLSATEPHGAVRDVVIKRKSRRRGQPRARASAKEPTKFETYIDSQGRPFVLMTAYPDLDLEFYAGVLASTIHGNEITDMVVMVASSVEVDELCDTGFDVDACYAYFDEPDLKGGLMIVAYDDPGVVHSMVHEYGHHIDHYLRNLAHLNLGCKEGDDGSRRWFFARDLWDDILRRTGCATDTPWEKLLPELFAEDFVALNGINDWFLPTFLPPSRAMLDAMHDDINRPFAPSSKRYEGFLSTRRGAKSRKLIAIRVEAPTLLSILLKGTAYKRRTDFDLYLYRTSDGQVLDVASRHRLTERMNTVIEPGLYGLAVRARKGYGSFKLVVELE